MDAPRSWRLAGWLALGGGKDGRESETKRMEVDIHAWFSSASPSRLLLPSFLSFGAHHELYYNTV